MEQEARSASETQHLRELIERGQRSIQEVKRLLAETDRPLHRRNSTRDAIHDENCELEEV